MLQAVVVKGLSVARQNEPFELLLQQWNRTPSPAPFYPSHNNRSKNEIKGVLKKQLNRISRTSKVRQFKYLYLQQRLKTCPRSLKVS